ncbi:septum formation family protein [Subtercola sp. YIM 133946]|uniref:septum formation family protein n=1 Tax=Subtercola sp. YIM 133946 TaxID=3118909 RepID=UPI002F91D490
MLPAAVVVVAVLVLGALFLLGTRLPGILSAAPSPTPVETPTLTPTPTPTPTSTTGRQLAGTYDWSDLRGGECINPFVSAWQQKFTVVDCAGPHGAQVMSTGSLSDDPTAAYPGQDAIAQQLNLLCQIPANFNSAILGAYPDVVWQADYPVNQAQWAAGMRSYSCFVSRSSSLPLTGDFAPAAFGG